MNMPYRGYRGRPTALSTGRPLRSHGRHPREKGIALVMVLWAVTLLTVIASSFAFSSRTETLLSRTQIASSRVRLLADAGIERALYELSKPVTDPTRWKFDGRTQVWEFDGAKLSITVRDETAKLDINLAPDELIRGLLKHAGLNDLEVASLSDAIADWRDADDFKRPSGAESRDYEAVGRDYLPANRPFESIDELRLVLGMTPDLFKKLRGSLTVYSSRKGFNSVTAPDEILYALRDVKREVVAQYVADRAKARTEGRPVSAFDPALAHASLNNAAYNIVAQAEIEDGSVFIRETSVQLPAFKSGKIPQLTWIEADRPPSSESGKGESAERN